ncbi:MAG: hypothetical protein MUE40_01315 [Anaerolineae bacterium]|jgi:hypothetical protein|nr:hypothetical protein [Anaerolineae bacterium]
MLDEQFPQSVIEKIGYYVYLLLEPDSGQVFYAGKGTGNRIFQHRRAALATYHDTDKLDHIRAILASGREVEYQILRHGLTEKEAFEVEAALIDFIGLENLSNSVAGLYTDERGKMNMADLIAKYSALPVTITEAVILITINRQYYHGISAADLYEYTRGNWVIGLRGRTYANYGLAVFRGIIREVYHIRQWETTGNRSPGQKTTRRWRFTGEVATHLRHYVGGSVEHYYKTGAQNPIRYLNCGLKPPAPC